jgi:hypothetical protein
MRRIKPHCVRLDPLRVLNKEKPCSADALLRAFLFPALRLASGLRSENKKALLLSQQGFFFVAEGGFEPPTFGL